MNEDYNYTISIYTNINNKKNIYGIFSYSNKQYIFNPLTILGDLSVFNYHKTKEPIISYTNEQALDNITIDKYQDKYYYLLSQYIRNFNYEEKIDMNLIDRMRLYFNINSICTIEYKKKIKKGNKIIDDYVPIYAGSCKEYKDMDDLFSNKYKSYDSKFFYECNTLTDVLFSILHYLIYNNYCNARYCNHCGKLYFYNHKKIKYCNRKSPYIGYEHLECEQAVRNIKQEIARKHKRIYNRFNLYDDKRFIDYMNNYYVLKDKIDECSSIKNLNNIEKFLDKYKAKKKN